MDEIDFSNNSGVNTKEEFCGSLVKHEYTGDKWSSVSKYFILVTLLVQRNAFNHRILKCSVDLKSKDSVWSFESYTWIITSCILGFCPSNGRWAQTVYILQWNTQYNKAAWTGNFAAP